MGAVTLSHRAHNALMFLALGAECRWFPVATMNEDALEMFEELEDADLIDVQDAGVALFVAINAAGIAALGFTLQ